MTADRYSRWIRRAMFDQLGFAGELWSVPVDYPARARLRPLHVAARRKIEREYGVQRETSAEVESSLEYWVTRSLLQDVIDAAGAVEHSVEKLITAADAAQDWVISNLPPRPAGAPAPTHGEWASTPEVRLAYLELANLLIWVRAVAERMDRANPSPWWYVPMRKVPVLAKRLRPRSRRGLLNCLAPGPLQIAASVALDTFRARTSDARLLANYALHAALLPGGGTASGLVSDERRLLLRVPDPVRRSVEIFDEFTFNEGREARAYAVELLAAVDAFVEELLDAFARARPARLGGPITGAGREDGRR